MPGNDESTLVVRLELLGRELTRLTEWSIDSEYLTSTDGFSFTTYSSDPDEIADLEQQPVTLYVSEANQLVGRIEASTSGENGGAISYEGRDYISDLVECNADPTLVIKAGMTLADSIKLAASPVGIDTVYTDSEFSLQKVRTGVSVRKKKAPGDESTVVEFTAGDLKPDPGVGLYEFLNRVVARHGATIQPTTERNALLITTPNYEQEPIGKLVRSLSDTSANNIKSAKARKDFSKFPTWTLFNGSQSRSGEESTQLSHAYDILIATQVFPELYRVMERSVAQGRRKPGAGKIDAGRLYRLLTMRDDESRSSEQLFRAALRAVGERLKDTLVYTVTVQGHVAPETGAIYSVDTIVRVDDDVARVHENLWIAHRTLKFSSTEGATTEMTCWRPGTFTV